MLEWIIIRKESEQKMAQIRKLENYLKGLKDGTGIGIAYIPFGVAIGLISAKSFSQILPMIGLTSFGMYAGGASFITVKGALCDEITSS